MSYSWLGKGRLTMPLLSISDLNSDGNIRYYEYEGDSLHSLSEYKSAEPRMSPFWRCFPARADLPRTWHDLPSPTVS